MIDPRYIEQIQLKAYIKDVIESYGIGLQRKGRYYWCCCPFHRCQVPEELRHGIVVGRKLVGGAGQV